MLLSCHVRISEWIYSLQFPEFQGTPCSKQARYQIHNHLVPKRTLNHLVKLFVYELCSYGFKSHCYNLRNTMISIYLNGVRFFIFLEKHKESKKKQTNLSMIVLALNAVFFDAFSMYLGEQYFLVEIRLHQCKNIPLLLQNVHQIYTQKQLGKNFYLHLNSNFYYIYI